MTSNTLLSTTATNSLRSVLVPSFQAKEMSDQSSNQPSLNMGTDKSILLPSMVMRKLSVKHFKNALLLASREKMSTLLPRFGTVRRMMSKVHSEEV